jgi:hypothetical protein
MVAKTILGRPRQGSRLCQAIEERLHGGLVGAEPILLTFLKDRDSTQLKVPKFGCHLLRGKSHEGIAKHTVA